MEPNQYNLPSEIDGQPQAQPKQGNFLQRGITKISDGIEQKRKEMEAEMLASLQKTAIKQFLPMVKKFLPRLEEMLKDFLSGRDNKDFKNDGKRKIVVMLLDGNENTKIRIFDADLVKVAPKVAPTSHEEAAKAVIKDLTLDEYVTGLVSGKFDSLTDILDEQI